ncbi:3'-5' DNA helicase [Coemansia sp. RSA 1646]|nr:3'-5' DNA helicase [Coemansia sp. RSA 1646]
MTTANNGNTDDFDDFDLDDISGELLDDLLKDDLEPDIEPTNTTIPPTTHSKATNGTSFQQQQWLQHKPQARVSPKRNGGQQTITSMFTRTAKSASHKHIPQKHPAQSRTGLDSIPVVPAFPSPPRKKPRLEDAQIQEIVDLIELEDDFSEFVSQSRPDTKPSHVKQHHKRPPQMFQTKETVIKNRGDNSLAESLHNMDRDAMRTYVYPLIDGQAARAYQQGAIHRCIFQNTLVALPTGMGKTMVAVVVMANYARWFPNSLSIFLAPTRPLVAQQMKACRGMLRAILKKSDEVHQTTAMQNLLLSSNWIVEMNGSTPPKARETLWNEAKFVFSTPQILQNDLKVGTLSIDNAKRISLLVIDEAHRATGKYAYGESINNLYTINHGREAPDFNPLHPAPPDPFRVMALTATPGSKIEAVREIVQRLHIAHIFLRTEESLDVVAYIHGRQIEEISIEMSPWLAAARDCLATVIGRSTNLLCNVCKAMPDPGDLKRISGFQVRMNRDRFLSHGGGSGSGMDTARISSEFTVLISLAHIMQLLSEHGLRPAWRAIRSWEMEVTRAAYEMGTSSRAKIQCFQSKEWTAMSQEFKFLVDMLDGKQPTTDSTSGSLANTASNSARALVVPSNSTMVGMTGPGGNAIPRRTDVVSNFFNVATKQHLAGNPVTTSASHVRIASLAHPGFLGHPKLERLVQIVKTHFEDSASEADGQSTKIIIFSQYRGSVSEIVDVLVKVSPLVICEQFIGQSSTGGSGGSSANGNSTGGGGRGRGRGRGAWQQSSRGHNGGYFRGRGRGGSSHRGGNHSQAGSGGGGRNSGYNSSDSDGGLLAELEGDVGEMRGQTQKEQLAVMNRFRNGQTNVIVATCVGEEGLDIGEVDLIINYDAPSSPIRMLQRIGRTGRARRGKVIVFLAKDTREENSYKKAQREYKSVQEKIASGRGLDLRADLSPPMVPPTLPPGLPARDEMFISRQEIAQDDAIAEDSGTNGRSKGRGTRKKRTSTDGTSVSKGIDPSEMCEFNQLSAKYRFSPAQPGDSIEDLVKSGKAKRAFEWSLGLDDELVRMAKTQGIELGLVDELSDERVDTFDKRASVATGSIFGDIGQPGAFDKLYDKDRVMRSTAADKQAPSGKMSEDSSLADGGSAANPQVLCPESDPEDNGIAPALDDLGAWVLSSFEDLQVDTPPTQPTPDASQKMQSKVADVFSAANVDPTSNNAIPGPGNAQHSVAEFVISDDSDLDRQLEAFDIDDQDIMILSDDDDNNDDDDDNTGERLAGSAVDVFNRKQQPLPLTQGPQTPSNYLDKLSGRTRMTLNSSPPSSSPVRMTRKRQLHSLSGSFENAESDVSGPAKRINMDCDLSSSPIGRIPKRLVRGKPLDTRQPTVSAANSNGPNKISRSIEPTRSPPVQQLKQIKARKLRPPPKQARNMFIDTEAGVGDSDDECDARAGKRARNGIDVSEDESDGEDLNQDLSSFVVDDDHVEFTSPDVLNRSANGSGALLGSGLDETPTRNSGDIYRRSLNESPITPMSEIMRRLAEREKTRRWVSDTPTKHHKPAGRNALDLRQSEAHDPDSDDGNDNKEDGSSSEDEADFARSSSEFDNVEDMFSQAG